MQIYFHTLLWSYLPSVPTILTTCVYKYSNSGHWVKGSGAQTHWVEQEKGGMISEDKGNSALFPLKGIQLYFVF